MGMDVWQEKMVLIRRLESRAGKLLAELCQPAGCLTRLPEPCLPEFPL